jgi:hypothetical protein
MKKGKNILAHTMAAEALVMQGAISNAQTGPSSIELPTRVFPENHLVDYAKPEM